MIYYARYYSGKKDIVLKKIRFAFYFIGIACMLVVPASAYVDPSVTTFALQAVAAVVVAAAAVAGVLWRKAKKKAQQVLNIDENSNKIVEEDVVLKDAEAAADAAVEAAAEAVDAAAEAAESASETLAQELQ